MQNDREKETVHDQLDKVFVVADETSQASQYHKHKKTRKDTSYTNVQP